MLVIGAGLSRNCKNGAGSAPPSWRGLLEELTRTFTVPGKARKNVNELVKQDRYLEAAELLRARARSQSKEQDFLQRIANVTDGGKKPTEQYKPDVIHDAVLRLEPEVLATTNYDRILERASRNGYNVHTYESPTLAADVRSGTPVLIKLHGTVDSASQIILTRSDYARLRREGVHVLEVLQALFLTRTALFVGYSFNDPDIHLLLENVLGARGEVPAHYLLTSDTIPDYQRDVYKYCYGTAVVTFGDSDYEEMRRMLQLLGAEVEARR